VNDTGICVIGATIDITIGLVTDYFLEKL